MRRLPSGSGVSFPTPAVHIDHRVWWILDNSGGATSIGRVWTCRARTIYEMHIGTFTPEGTWQAAAKELAELARIGITVIEMMPIADFPGEFGWGYDGVDFFSPPSRLYGTPDDFRVFVDHAHSVGWASFSTSFITISDRKEIICESFPHPLFMDRHENDWGGYSMNFDGPHSGPVREFFLTNGSYWIDEFHFDGFGSTPRKA